jgi:outer membrane protein OmpA-like peptidoglycan-associated protein
MTWNPSRLMVWVLLGLAALLSGCASSRVTLLPDQNGHVGAVTVATKQGQQRIDQAYGSVAVGSANAAPGATSAVDPKSFENSHRALLDAQPSLPRSFVLNFKFDSMELTPASTKLLPEVLDAVRERMPTEVTIFGYTDAVGESAYNLQLSAQRARVVEKLMKKIAPDLPVDVQYFGDKLPLVPSRPGVPEPRNRRAEIVVL